SGRKIGNRIVQAVKHPPLKAPHELLEHDQPEKEWNAGCNKSHIHGLRSVSHLIRERKPMTLEPMRQGLNELIRWRARTTPELPALWYEGREWNYRDLDVRSSQVADALVQAGVKRGDRVAILDKNSDRYLETVYGISKAGAIFVPVNWRQAAPEVAYVL